MRICHDLAKGITCIYANDNDGSLYCNNNKCEYKEIDYKRMMEEDKHTYKREHRRTKQVR